jgi:Flp pilus assembly protein TadD
VNWYDQALQLRPDNPQFLGNDARARYSRGDKDDHERQLLEEVAMKDSRPEWNAWTREQLARMGPESATRPTSAQNGNGR